MVVGRCNKEPNTEAVDLFKWVFRENAVKYGRPRCVFPSDVALR